MQTLTDSQAEQFLQQGYVRIEQCFDPALAEQWRALAFDRLGYDAADPATWSEARVHLPGMNRIEVRDVAPAAYGAICDLMGGEHRFSGPVRWSDGFIINFNMGADDPWRPPSAQAPGWHKDGDFFRHFLDSPEQGLLTIILWSDIEPQSGGTFVAPDSIKPIARHLLAHPEGLLPSEAGFGQCIHECREFAEITGAVGDVLLIHPFMLHASSQNPSGRARFITNPPVGFNEPMCFDGRDPSLVEQVILRALDVSSLDFDITGVRERIVPERVKRQQQMLDEQQARLDKA